MVMKAFLKVVAVVVTGGLILVCLFSPDVFKRESIYPVSIFLVFILGFVFLALSAPSLFGRIRSCFWPTHFADLLQHSSNPADRQRYEKILDTYKFSPAVVVAACQSRFAVEYGGSSEAISVVLGRSIRKIAISDDRITEAQNLLPEALQSQLTFFEWFLMAKGISAADPERLEVLVDGLFDITGPGNFSTMSEQELRKVCRLLKIDFNRRLAERIASANHAVA